jgi:hypothetical protein
MAAVAVATASKRAQRARDEAVTMVRRQQEARNLAGRYHAAAPGERLVAAALIALTAAGWRLLVDPRWPGSRDGARDSVRDGARDGTWDGARDSTRYGTGDGAGDDTRPGVRYDTRRSGADMILIGPGGVFVIDVKNWRDEPTTAGDRLAAGVEDRHAEVNRLLAEARVVEDAVGSLGLSPVAIQPVIIFAGRRIHRRLDRALLLGQQDAGPALVALPKRLTPPQAKAVAAHLAEAYPDYEAPSLADRPEPIVRHQFARQQQPALPAAPSLFDVDQLQRAALESALAAPIESWMTFLHPDQAALVRRVFHGPARISGPAGTGKTVVGLHRAVHLAQRSTRRVLFVTYANNLPRVQYVLARRLAPAVAERIEFTSLHTFATGLLADAGIPVRLRGDQADALLSKAWQSTGRHTGLVRTEPNPTYWFDEVNYVIKGRQISTLSQYVAAERRGRRTPVRVEDRRAVWALYEEYERLRIEAGIHDFTDVLVLALDELRRNPLERPYAAVVADEVQDLTLVGVRLLHALVGDATNGLLLIGDGQQAVYPGGYRLSEAGIAIAGRRGVVLDTNYRNAREIVDCALRVVAGDMFDDIDERTVDGSRQVETVYYGGQVTRVVAPTLADHDRTLLAELRSLLPSDEEPGALGDAAILCATLKEVHRYQRMLIKAGLPVQRLESYDGAPTDACKLGTYHRVKGLEFKQVFLPCHDLALRDSDAPGAAAQERGQLARRRLFVAITRARDHVWLGSVAS